ncbi:unnamed protein product, partial [Mesorhabditis belari]|uniref:Uncharacterized protein n=1 Tax=Mesorhabditis belari TaxID=2138241 RepID=A0AAF3EEM7_9BILA
MQLPSPIKKIPENEVLFDDLFENSANFRDSFNSPIAFDSNPPQNERASINLDKTFRQTDFIEPDVDNPLEEKSIFDSVEQTIQSVKEKASTGNYLDEFKLRKVIRIKGRVVLSPYKGETKKRRIEPKIGEWFNNLEDFSIDQLYFVAKTLIELHEKKKICKIVGEFKARL